MVSHRLQALRKALSELLKKIAQDHYLGKMSHVFLVNNFHFIVTQFKQIKDHAFLKEDTKMFEEAEQLAITSYIEATLTEHFAAMMLAVEGTQTQKTLEHAV
jgi:hypothetical protein